MTRPRFHLAFPVHDIEATRAFYVDVLQCTVGREAARWIDFNLQGHQLSAHLRHQDDVPSASNEVDGDQVPLRHFGLILAWEQWEMLADRIRTLQIPFLIEPKIRFRGRVGEQGTFFVKDPSGNALEFKSFRNETGIFQRD